jgi:hypothetical protein
VDAQSKVPALTIVEAEQFWTDGRDARQDATGKEPDTTTTDLIDVPGVGVVPGSEIPPVCTRREDGGGVSTPRGDSAAGVHTISLRDRLRASTRVEERISFIIPPEGVAKLSEIAGLRGSDATTLTLPDGTPDFRAIGAELLSALYSMIGRYGMPLERELSDEVHTALLHAEVAKVDEVLL